MLSVQVSDFEDICLLIQHDRLYAISVRQASALPAASFRFHLTMDTLAVRLTVPPAGPVEDFHLQVSAPCRAHKDKTPHPLFGEMGPSIYFTQGLRVSRLLDLRGYTGQKR